jgi:hypothetical protein
MQNDRDMYRAEVNVSSSRRNANNSADWRIIYEDKIKTL